MTEILAPEAPVPRHRALLALPAVRWALSLVLLAGVGQLLWAKGGEWAAHPIAVSWPLAVGALGGLTLYLLAAGELWRGILRALGAPFPFRPTFGILFSSNLAKYLPGGVWNLLGRVVLYEREGVPPLTTTIALLMETAAQVVAALLVGLTMLPTFAAGTPFGDPRALGVGVLAIVLGMHPRFLNAWLALGERLTGRPLPRLPFSYRFVLGLLALYTLNWLLLGASFALLGQALAAAPLTLGQVGLLVGAFAVAWNAGVFAFFFPAGLGVREAALTLLLASAFPPAWPAALALVARLWFLVGELVFFGVALRWLPKPRGDTP